MSETLTIKWTTSRARDTYGYNICTLRMEGERRRFRCMGGGYDMVGTVFGEWLAASYPDRLRTLDPSDFYGMAVRDDGSVRLDGACGVDSMRRIAEAIGLSVRPTVHRGETTGFVVGTADDPDDDDAGTYRIVRFFRDDRPEQVVVRGLTLAQAQAHCSREDTHGPDWFDGYTRED